MVNGAEKNVSEYDSDITNTWGVLVNGTERKISEYDSDHKEALNISSLAEVLVDGTERNISEQNNTSCVKQTKRDIKSLKITILIMRVCISLSMVSIIVIIILHVAIKDLRKLNFTKLKIPFMICLFFSFMFFIIKNNIDFSATKIIAVFMGLVLQYFSLGIFFWLTSMSLDIWLTFRRIEHRENNEAVQAYRMRCYYLFSLGGPAVISFLTGVIQFALTPEDFPYFHPR